MISYFLSILNGKIIRLYTWEVLLFLNRFLNDKILSVPQGKTLIVPSSEVLGYYVDGEVYIL